MGAPLSARGPTSESRRVQWPPVARARRGAPPRRVPPSAMCLARPAGGSICQGETYQGWLLSIPNLITLARILSVPVMVWAIASGEMLFAFVLFVVAGVSDAVDGYLAKRFGMTSELGAYLDPLADKALIVSIYIALGINEAIPRWLVILVVSRDI